MQQHHSSSSTTATTSSTPSSSSSTNSSASKMMCPKQENLYGVAPPSAPAHSNGSSHYNNNRYFPPPSSNNSGSNNRSGNLGHLDEKVLLHGSKNQQLSPVSGGGGIGTSSLTDDHMMTISQSIDSLNTIGSNGITDDVRTLFVSGLPMDTKPRELYLLFRGYKGYISSTLKPSGKNGKLTAPVGFVTFSSREEAEISMNDLQGVKFDPESAQQMRLEFARSNTKVTKPKVGFLSLAQQFMGAPGGGLPPHAAIIQQIPGCEAFLFDQSLLQADANWAQLGYENAFLTATGILPSAAAGLHPSLLQALMPVVSSNGGGTGLAGPHQLISGSGPAAPLMTSSMAGLGSGGGGSNPYLAAAAAAAAAASNSLSSAQQQQHHHQQQQQQHHQHHQQQHQNNGPYGGGGYLQLGFPATATAATAVGLLNYNALMKDLVNN